jgi:hypothetical protein
MAGIAIAEPVGGGGLQYLTDAPLLARSARAMRGFRRRGPAARCREKAGIEGTERGQAPPSPGCLRWPGGRVSAPPGGTAKAPARKQIRRPLPLRTYQWSHPPHSVRNRTVTLDSFRGIGYRAMITQSYMLSLGCPTGSRLFPAPDEDFRSMCRTGALVVACHYVTSYRREGTSASRAERLCRM